MAMYESGHGPINGSCAFVCDREHCIAESTKQLNEESIHKFVKFKDKILQNLAEKSDDIFKDL